jgi:hypothetical protein
MALQHLLNGPHENRDMAAGLSYQQPLLLSTLDLSHWMSIMHVSTLEGGMEKALTRLKEAHSVLAALLEKDEMELEEATNNMRVVETALRAANAHEDWSERPHQTKATEPLNVSLV